MEASAVVTTRAIVPNAPPPRPRHAPTLFASAGQTKSLAHKDGRLLPGRPPPGHAYAEHVIQSDHRAIASRIFHRDHQIDVTAGAGERGTVVDAGGEVAELVVGAD